MPLRESLLRLPLFALPLLSCRAIEVGLEHLAEVCAREAQVVTTFEEGDDEFRLCSPERCTLREAIVTANACGGREVVQLRAGTYRLTSRDDPPAGNPRTESDRQDARVGPVGLPRITGDVVIRGAGATIERDPEAASFRIFHVVEGGRLTLEDVTVANGLAGAGGGVHNEGSLILTNTTLRNNRAQRSGGAIHNEGSLSVRDGSSLRANGTERPRVGSEIGGGAIYNSESATAEIQGSEVLENRTGGGNGGALYNSGTVTLETTSLAGNQALHGGAIHVLGGAVTVEKSLLDGNSASGDGGGVNIIAGTLVVRSSTISGNRSSIGGGIAFQGSGSAQLLDVTIAQNSASTAGAGGGLNVGASGPLEARNTIVGGNSARDCASAGDFRARGENLDSDDTCPGFTRRGNPLLGPLQDNGGSTRTHALGPGSPAIDSGADCLSGDQRGFRRPVGRCDIGAYEVQR